MFEKILNKLEKRITRVSGQDFKPQYFSFEWFLCLISVGFEMGVKCRIRLYEKGILKQKHLPCFVVSVGNIVVGGAGKTPMAIHLAEILGKMGKKVVVISRGYKGEYKNDVMIVSDGDQVFADVKAAGDEAFMMARRRRFPVVVGRDRFKAGMEAVNRFNPDVIVLDDGFQHLKLKRDLDFLLLDYSNPLGNNRFLPAGRLRENPATSSKRADALIFTRSPDMDEQDKQIRKIQRFYPGVPWFKSVHKPFVLKQVPGHLNAGKKISSLGTLKGKQVLLFSGLAKNPSFYITMKESGVNILDHLEFKDHYRYKRSDILNINRKAARSCAEFILTTEKDWVKLESDIKWDMDLIVIGIRIEFEDSQNLESLIRIRTELK